MRTAHRNEEVRIHKILLSPQDRAPQLPEDTRQVPLEMWVKGYLLDESARLGDLVRIETATGRQVSGTLQEIAPAWGHGFGKHVPELEVLKRSMKASLQQKDREEQP